MLSTAKEKGRESFQVVALVAEYLGGQGKHLLLKQHTNIPLIYKICMATPLDRLQTEIPVMSAAYSFTLN